MPAPDITYFMGQGKTYWALRAANAGIIGGFLYAGDVEQLQVSSNQTFDDIQENTSGNRNVAAHIPTGNTMGFKVSCKQWTLDSLAKAAYAALGQTPVAAASVVAELVSAYGGTMTPLANPGVSAVVAVLGGTSAKVAAVAVTAAGTGGTPGAALPVTFTGGTPSTPATANAIVNAAGGVDHIEMTNYGAGYASPPTATVTGITAGTFAVKMGGTALVAGTDYDLNAAMGSLTWRAASVNVPSGSVPLTGNGLATPISVNYNYASWFGKIEAVTRGIQEFCVRFEGLNTANGNAPVVVTCWRVALNMAALFDLIANRSGTLELSGMLLPDPTRDGITQSQYWTAVKV